jgi:soluble lytic murein transglycosylase-like protein
MNCQLIGIIAILALGLPLGFTQPALAHESSHEHAAHHDSRVARHIADTYHIRTGLAQEIVNASFEYGKKRGLNPYLILAVIAQESSFNVRAVGKRGDLGLMQVLPYEHADLVRAIGGRHELFNPIKNIDVGTRILKQFIDLSGGSWSRGLTKYNGGGRHYARDVMRHYYRLKRY